MPARPLKPWLYRGRGWYCWWQGKKIRLSADPTPAGQHEAETAFHRLLAGIQPESGVTVTEVCDRFVGWVKANRDPKTAAWHRQFLVRFVGQFGPLAAATLTPITVSTWLDQRTEWSPSTRHGAAASIKRAFSWAASQGLLAADPIKRLAKPRAERRERVLSGDEWGRMLAGAGLELSEALRIIRETGCRRGEFLALTAGSLDREHRRWIVERSATKGKRKARVIYPPAWAWDRSVSLATAHPVGPLFRGPSGQPWTANSIRLAVARLVRSLGLKGVSLHVLRHTFVTEALTRGVGVAEVAELIGDNAEMVLRVYQHLNQRADHLRAAAAKAISGDAESRTAAEPPPSARRPRESSRRTAKRPRRPG